MFSEIHIQQEEQYVDEESFGCHEEGHLYKRVMCIMIVGLKKSVPYVIQVVPRINLSRSVLSVEFFKSNEGLQKINYN